MVHDDMLCLYKNIRNRLKEECDEDGYITYEQIKKKFKGFRLNKKVWGLILVELEKTKLIEKVSEKNEGINHKARFLVK